MITTKRVPVTELQPGDCYLWGEAGGTGRTTREVLGVCLDVASRRYPLGARLLEVRKADGNVTLSFLSGSVHVLCEVSA